MENKTNIIETSAVSETQQILTDRQMLEEIYENTRKAKNYMKWSLIITVALVVIPLLATLFVIPFALKSLTSIYTSVGAVDQLSGSLNSDSVQGLINQYTK